MTTSGIDESVDFFDMVGQTNWNRSIQRTLIHWLGLSETDQVLDTGCRAGHLAMQLAQRTEWVTGLDTSENLLNRARMNARDFSLSNTSFVMGNIHDIPCSDAQFDLVLCLNQLFLADDPVKPLQEFLRVCKPDGHVVVMNPSSALNPWSAQAYCEEHELDDFDRDSFLSWATAASRKRLYNVEELEMLVSTAGGRVIESFYLLDGLAAVLKIEHSF